MIQKGLIQRFYEFFIEFYLIHDLKDIMPIYFYCIYGQFFQLLAIQHQMNTANDMIPTNYQIMFYLGQPTLFGYALHQHFLMLITSLIFTLAIIFGLIYCFINNKKQNPVVVYVTLLFNGYFLALILDVCVQSLCSLEMSVTVIVLASLVALLTLIIFYFCFTFADIALTINEVGLQQVQIDQTYFLSLLVKILIPLISASSQFFPESNTAHYLSNALIICYGLLNWHHFFSNLPFTSFLKCKTFLVCLSCYSAFALSCFLQSIQIISLDQYVLICVLVSPLLARLSLNMFESIINNIIVKVQGSQNDDLSDEIAGRQRKMQTSFSLQAGSSGNGQRTMSQTEVGGIGNNQKKRKQPFLTHKFAFYKRELNTIQTNQKLHFLLLCELAHHESSCEDEFCFCKQKSYRLSSQSSIIIIDNKYYQNFIVNEVIAFMANNFSNLIDMKNQIKFLRCVKYLEHIQKFTFVLYQIVQMYRLNQRYSATGSSSIRYKSGNWFQHCISVLVMLTKHSILHAFKKKNTNQKVEHTMESCNLYFYVAEKKNQLGNNCLSLLRERITIYKNVRHGVKSIEELLRQNHVFMERILSVQEQIKRFYKKVPSSHNQSLLCYFYCEVKCDVQSAINMAKALNFGNRYNYFHNLISQCLMNVFSTDVVVFNVGYTKYQGQLIWYSDNAPARLGYTKMEFSFVEKLTDLMPITIAHYHDDMVRNYLITGEQQIMRQVVQSFVKNQSGYIEVVDMFIDFNFDIRDELAFFCFINRSKSQNSFLLLDFEGFIEGVTNSLLELAGLQGYSVYETFYRFHADMLFPDYDQLWLDFQGVEGNLQVEKTAVKLVLPLQEYFLNFSSISNNSSNGSVEQWQKNQNGNYNPKFKYYQCDIKVQLIQHEIFSKNIKYFIVEALRIVEQIPDLKQEIRDTIDQIQESKEKDIFNIDMIMEKTGQETGANPGIGSGVSLNQNEGKKKFDELKKKKTMKSQNRRNSHMKLKLGFNLMKVKRSSKVEDSPKFVVANNLEALQNLKTAVKYEEPEFVKQQKLKSENIFAEKQNMLEVFNKQYSILKRQSRPVNKLNQNTLKKLLEQNGKGDTFASVSAGSADEVTQNNINGKVKNNTAKSIFQKFNRPLEANGKMDFWKSVNQAMNDTNKQLDSGSNNNNLLAIDRQQSRAPLGFNKVVQDIMFKRPNLKQLQTFDLNQIEEDTYSKNTDTSNAYEMPLVDPIPENDDDENKILGSLHYLEEGRDNKYLDNDYIESADNKKRDSLGTQENPFKNDLSDDNCENYHFTFQENCSEKNAKLQQITCNRVQSFPKFTDKSCQSMDMLNQGKIEPEKEVIQKKQDKTEQKNQLNKQQKQKTANNMKSISFSSSGSDEKEQSGDEEQVEQKGRQNINGKKKHISSSSSSSSASKSCDSPLQKGKMSISQIFQSEAPDPNSQFSQQNAEIKAQRTNSIIINQNKIEQKSSSEIIQLDTCNINQTDNNLLQTNEEFVVVVQNQGNNNLPNTNQSGGGVGKVGESYGISINRKPTKMNTKTEDQSRPKERHATIQVEEKPVQQQQQKNKNQNKKRQSKRKMLKLNVANQIQQRRGSQMPDNNNNGGSKKSKEGKMNLHEKKLKQQQMLNNEQEAGNEQQSVSSLIRGSKYSYKYKLQDCFQQEITFTGIQKSIILLKVIELIIILLAIVLNLIIIFNSLDNFISFLYQIKLINKVMHPYSTAYSELLNYQKVIEITQIKDQKYSMPEDQYFDVLQLVLTNITKELQNELVLGYEQDRVKEFLVSSSLDVWHPLFNSIQGHSSVILLNAVKLLQMFMQQIQPLKLVTQRVIISNQLFMQFLQANFLPFYNFFKHQIRVINDEIYEYDDEKSFMQLIYVVLISIFTCSTFTLSYLLFARQVEQEKAIFRLIETVSSDILELEIQNLDTQLRLSEADQEQIFEYFFDLKSKEEAIVQMIQQNEQKTYIKKKSTQSNFRHVNHYIRIHQDSISTNRFKLVTIFTFFMFFFYIVYTYLQFSKYLENFEKGLFYYQDVCICSGHLSVLLIFNSNIHHFNTNSDIHNHSISQSSWFIDSQQFQFIKNEYNEVLENLGKFTNMMGDLGELHLLESDYREYILSLYNADACQQQNLTPQLEALCSSVMNSVLQKGVLAFFTIKINQFQKDAVRNFSDFADDDQGLTMLVNFAENIVQIHLQSLEKYMKERNQEKKSELLVMSSIFGLFFIFYYVYIFFIEIKEIRKHFFLSKQFVYLLPLTTLICEETCIKIMASLCKRFKLKDINSE